MLFDETLIGALGEELKKPLPGIDAQYRMAPTYRPRLTTEQIAGHHPKSCGVLLLLYKHQSELRIVFTQRRKYNGVHSGQMSFPGGKKDDADSDMTQTALRETKEEIGIEAKDIQILGKLTELYIPPSNFLVYPIVGYGGELKKFVPQAKEVAEIVEIPVSFFLDKKNINLQTEITIHRDTIAKVPAYLFNGRIIWGATAIMMSEFTFILEHLLERR